MLLKYEVWQYVDGSFAPDNQDFQDDKDVCALSLVGLSIHPSLQYLIANEEHALHAWNKLREGSLPRGAQGSCALVGKITSL